MRRNIARFYTWAMSGPFDTGVAITMLLMVIGVLLQPDAGPTGYISRMYSPLIVEVFLLATVLFSIEMVIHPSATRFAVCSTPVASYAIMAVMYWWYNLAKGAGAVSLPPIVYTLGFYVAINWINARRTKFQMRGANDHRRVLD